MNLTIKEIIKDNYVKFSRYRKGILYYHVVILRDVNEDDAGIYDFPVPIDDCGDADFPASDKAIMFMRYIRKALEDGTFIKRVV
ncbi:MAG: hypothetical protein HQK53_13590 [Oligoflexia bacterium]|nr:hypothetical protein [Oligoflexia bacterium]